MATEKRLIDANALMEMLKKDHCKNCDSYNGTMCRVCWIDDVDIAVDVQSTVDAVEVVHGRWMEFNSFMTCSECDTDWYYGDNDCDRFDYCPNCGAKMDGGVKNA